MSGDAMPLSRFLVELPAGEGCDLGLAEGRHGQQRKPSLGRAA